MIIFEWTGEFRNPKMDEYYLTSNGVPVRATLSFHDENNKHFILRRVEAEPNDDKETEMLKFKKELIEGDKK